MWLTIDKIESSYGTQTEWLLANAKAGNLRIIRVMGRVHFNDYEVELLLEAEAQKALQQLSEINQIRKVED